MRCNHAQSSTLAHFYITVCLKKVKEEKKVANRADKDFRSIHADRSIADRLKLASSTIGTSHR